MTRFSRLLSLSLAAALAACSGKAPEAAQSGESAASAPEAKPGLSLAGGQLVLPAVSGNPGAAYFTLTNMSAKPVTLAAVEIAGAGMAMLHETKEVAGHSEMTALESPQVPAGGVLVFARGGKHVMVMGLPGTLTPGGTVEITLTFDDGDKLSAPLAVVGPGGA